MYISMWFGKKAEDSSSLHPSFAAKDLLGLSPPFGEPGGCGEELPDRRFWS
jgi:hypothetical protein